MIPFEQKIKEKYEKDGWEVLKSGWPDFLLIKGNKIKAVEVKSEKDKLRPNQHKCLTALSKVMPIFTVYEKWGYGGSKEKIETLIYPYEVTLDYQGYLKSLEQKKKPNKEYEGLGVS